MYFNSQEKLKTMLIQNFEVTNKEHYLTVMVFSVGSTEPLTFVVLVRAACYQLLTTPENTINYHNALCLSPQNFA